MENVNSNRNTKEVKSQLTKGKRFRRSTIVYNFINFIVKKIYLINDDVDDNNIDSNINKKQN